MRHEDVVEVLNQPLARELLGSAIPARLAYARLLAYKAGNRGTVRYDVEAGGTVTVPFAGCVTDVTVSVSPGSTISVTVRLA